MDRERIARRAQILETFSAVRSPEEGFLADEDYATLIEALLDTRAGQASDDEIFALVQWADGATLRSRLLEEVIRGERGLDLHLDGEVLLDDAPPANLIAIARDRVPSSPDTDDAGTVAARLAFVAGRLNAERTWSEAEVAQVEAWAQEGAANRSLLDIILAYPDLGLDITWDGRVVILPAGAPD